MTALVLENFTRRRKGKGKGDKREKNEDGMRVRSFYRGGRPVIKR